MNKRRMRPVSSVLAILGGAYIATVPAHADTTDDLLAKLYAKGILSQEEYSELRQRKAAEPAAAARPSVSAGSTAGVSAGTGPGVLDSSGFVKMMDKGIGVHVGNVDVALSGELNGFYVYDSPQRAGANTTVNGGLAAVGSAGNSSVRNGLLPGDINLDLSTHEEGLEIHAHFGMYPGLNSVSGVGGANSAGNPHALGTAGIDFRQQFITVGNDQIGTFKAGRDIGLFGQEAILNDFTLFGVGSTGGNLAPSNTSLGRIGIGYIYADFMPQITYTTPSFSGFQAAVGLFQPLGEVNFSGLSGQLSQHGSPQIQAKVTWTSPVTNPLQIKLWGNLVTQNVKTLAAAGDTVFNGPKSIQAIGGDFGAKLDYASAELVGYGYVGSAIGSTGLLFDGVSLTGQERQSSGYYFQGSYTIQKFTFSASYGDSHLDQASGEVQPLLVKDNESYAFGGKYKLTSWVDLVAEFTHTTATAQGGNSADEDTVAAGAIAFF